MTKALRFLAALLVAVPVFAQAQQRIYSQPELDQMLAPVALYPDALLSQVLMAATYPFELNEAAAWSRANPGLQGDDAMRAVQHQDWDPSVKSLVAFPQMLVRMAENSAWTQSLGDAFIAQEPQVMDTVQQLRRRAQAAGNLQSGEHLYVQQQDQTIVIQPASPQYVYVPYYDPMVVYGPWWWSAYRPVYWAPWPGYARHYHSGATAGFWWGRPVGVSVNFFFGNFDWRHRHARVTHPNAYYYRSAALENRSHAVSTERWRPDARRREAFAARRTNQVQQQIQVQSVAPVQAQRTVQSRTERREDRREERRTERQAAPAALPVIEWREERQAARVQARQEQRASMPAAHAPQTPRAERQEQRPERREQRDERRAERGQKG